MHFDFNATVCRSLLCVCFVKVNKKVRRVANDNDGVTTKGRLRCRADDCHSKVLLVSARAFNCEDTEFFRSVEKRPLAKKLRNLGIVRL
jgi:hypothetical protein